MIPSTSGDETRVTGHFVLLQLLLHASADVFVQIFRGCVLLRVMPPIKAYLLSQIILESCLQQDSLSQHLHMYRCWVKIYNESEHWQLFTLCLGPLTWPDHHTPSPQTPGSSTLHCSSLHGRPTPTPHSSATQLAGKQTHPGTRSSGPRPRRLYAGTP